MTIPQRFCMTSQYSEIHGVLAHDGKENPERSMRKPENQGAKGAENPPQCPSFSVSNAVQFHQVGAAGSPDGVCRHKHDTVTLPQLSTLDQGLFH